jgi:DNA (cytosine-5)-methyltransferase 1
MYETIRIVSKLKPKYVIWENVKNLLSKNHRHNFDAYLETMHKLGYYNTYQVLNAKDYGIPQNRERVFTVSILGNENYEFPKNECLTKMPIDYLEENIDEKYYLTEKNLEWLEEHNKNHKEKGTGFIFKPKNPNTDVANTIRANASWCPTDNAFFEFPPKQELKLKLKDMLEDEVDEKYYLSDKMIKYISASGTANFKNPDCKINLEVARPLTTDQNKRAGTTNYISDELPNNYDLNLKSKQKQLISLIEKTEFEEGKVLNMDLYNQTTNENISQCLTEPHHNSQRLFDGLRIRKLTPKECWRLMGFDDEDYEKAAKVNSNTQLYKQAGNSIVVNVLEAILKNLLF